MRLDAYLSSAGVASRRASQEIIRSGRVRVNGRIARRPGRRLTGGETVCVDGKPVVPPMTRTYVALHKPRGYLTTAEDPRGRRTVLDLVPRSPRLFPVGRLDADTSGLLLMTDDGDWAAEIEHPRGAIPRVYEVCVRGVISSSALADLRAGIPLADGVARIERIRPLENGGDPDHSRWRIVMTEGRYREIRRLMATVGHPVVALRRVGFGSVHLGDLPPGKWRSLRPGEVRELARMAQRGAR